MSITFDTKVILETHRCYECGRWFGFEMFGVPARLCPCCSSARIDRAVAAQEKAERSVRSLRGALTKARGRK